MGNALVLALALGGFAGGLLLGIFAGFKVTTRDASILATLDKRVAQSLSLSSEAKARADALEATWTEHLLALERKRAQARAERQRADQAAARAEASEAAPEEPVEPESPRERRRAIARGLIRGGSAPVAPRAAS